MMETRGHISLRLQARGLRLVEINRLARDVANITVNKRNLNMMTLKQSLVRLGWEEKLLDNHTLGLIFLLLEADSCTYPA
ncbi:MAG: hypothetical protein ACOZF0_20315 [Thermodesulfobacteriota bacterium]